MEYGCKTGISNIEKEITLLRIPASSYMTPSFCHGSGNNFNIVKNFIDMHSQKTNLKDRLHAIWFDSIFR